MKNELFETEPNEDNQEAYRRGETIFDRSEKDIENLTEIIGLKKKSINSLKNVDRVKINWNWLNKRMK